MQNTLSKSSETNSLRKISPLLEVFIVLGITIGFIQLLLPWVEEDSLWQQAVVWLGNILMLLMILGFARSRQESWKDYGIDFKWPGWRSAFQIMLKAIGLFAAVILVTVMSSMVLANFGDSPPQSDLSQYAFLKGNIGLLILSLLGVYIVSSFGEEVVYRAFLIGRFSQVFPDGRWKSALVILMSALLFGLAHYTWGPVGIFQTSLMGLLLAIGYLYWGRNLWVNIWCHVLMDTLLLVQLY